MLGVLGGMGPMATADFLAKLVRATPAARDQDHITTLVCSAAEAASVRRIVGPGRLIVTPGIRPAGAEAGDQKRVMTPAAARTAGIDHVVVGRPITGAADPRAVAQAIVADLA